MAQDIVPQKVTHELVFPKCHIIPDILKFYIKISIYGKQRAQEHIKQYHRKVTGKTEMWKSEQMNDFLKTFIRGKKKKKWTTNLTIKIQLTQER